MDCKDAGLSASEVRNTSSIVPHAESESIAVPSVVVLEAHGTYRKNVHGLKTTMVSPTLRLGEKYVLHFCSPNTKKTSTWHLDAVFVYGKSHFTVYLKDGETWKHFDGDEVTLANPCTLFTNCNSLFFCCDKWFTKDFCKENVFAHIFYGK